jgi:DNA helicase INO80
VNKADDQIEIDLLVDLSQRQRSIYKALRQRVSVSDLIAQANNLTDSGTKNLMNLVMQFRKVCNHPDLFERADVVSPFLFGTFSNSGNLARQGDQLYCPDSAANAINVELPRIVWEEGVNRPGEKVNVGSDTHVLSNLMSIWKEGWVNDELKNGGHGYGFVKMMGSSPGEVVRKARAHPLVSLLEDAAGENDLVHEGPYKRYVIHLDFY